jgi:hypothetical protein
MVLTLEQGPQSMPAPHDVSSGISCSKCKIMRIIQRPSLWGRDHPGMAARCVSVRAHLGKHTPARGRISKFIGWRTIPRLNYGRKIHINLSISLTLSLSLSPSL